MKNKPQTQPKSFTLSDIRASFELGVKAGATIFQKRFSKGFGNILAENLKSDAFWAPIRQELLSINRVDLERVWEAFLNNMGRK